MSLPEKWMIIRNSINYRELNSWSNEKFGKGLDLSSTRYIGCDKNNVPPSQRSLYAEITYDQFKQYVLNQEIIYEIY